MKSVMEIDGKEYIGLSLLRDELGISWQTFYRWQRQGLIPPPIAIGRYRFYNRDDVWSQLLTKGVAAGAALSK